jgi:hypothetical protein
MILWRTSALAAALAAGRVSADQKFRYLLVLELLWVALGYLAYLLPVTSRGWLFYYEGVVVLVITGAGLVRCRQAYAPATDDRLLEHLLILSLPLTIKVTLFWWGAAWFIPFALARVAESLSVSSEPVGQAIQFFYSAVHVFTPFVAAVVAAACFWYRMSIHLATVAAGPRAT